MKSAVAPNIFATEDVSIGTGDRNARRVQSLQVLIKIIRSYSAEILRLTLLFLTLSETVARERFAFGGGAIFQFLARKGTRAIYLDDLITFPKPELEILFPRGTSFRILSKQIRHGITYFMVELISASPTTKRS